MKLLNAVLKQNQIQEFISENEDSAFDYLKENFDIKYIYNYVIENFNSYINNESDLEEIYNNIKTSSRNYTLNIINESNILTDDNLRSFVYDMMEDLKASGVKFKPNLNYNEIVNFIKNNKNIRIDMDNAYIRDGGFTRETGRSFKMLVANKIASLSETTSMKKVIRIMDSPTFNNKFGGYFFDRLHNLSKTAPPANLKLPAVTSYIDDGLRGVSHSIPTVGGRTAIFAAIGAGITGAGVFVWNKLTQKEVNDIPPEVKTASDAARQHMESGDGRTMAEILHSSVSSKSQTITELSNSSPKSIEKNIITPLISELPSSDAQQVEETWNNTLDFASTSKYGAIALGLVAIGLIMKYKFRRS
jgi:hypothetical protein